MFSNLGTIAEDLFRQGFNCAEALSSAVAENLHIESRAIPHIATPFGAGMGGKGNACGCLTGGIMGIGLTYGRSDPKDVDRKKMAYEKTKLFCDKFTERFGSINCIDLCGIDISNEEGLKRYHDEGLRDKCAEFVRETGEILSQIL